MGCQCLHGLRIFTGALNMFTEISLSEQNYRQWHPVINWFRSFLLRPCESTALQSFQPRHNIQALVSQNKRFFASFRDVFGKGAPEIKAIGLPHISCKSLLIFVDRHMLFFRKKGLSSSSVSSTVSGHSFIVQSNKNVNSWNWHVFFCFYYHIIGNSSLWHTSASAVLDLDSISTQSVATC